MKKNLYVDRPLLNAEEVIEWARKNGFGKMLEPSAMHVTVAFSKAEVDWSKFDPLEDMISIKGGRREVKPLGDEGAVVLMFESSRLTDRWLEFVKGGCSWDHESYHPHISVTYFGKGMTKKPESIEPYSGELQFGPEKFKELDLNWKRKIEEK